MCKHVVVVVAFICLFRLQVEEKALRELLACEQTATKTTTTGKKTTKSRASREETITRAKKSKLTLKDNNNNSKQAKSECKHDMRRENIIFCV